MGDYLNFHDFKNLLSGARQDSRSSLQRAFRYFTNPGHLRAPGALFVSVNKAGKIEYTSNLSGEALRKMLDKRSKQTQLSKPIIWHDFRRTFAGNLWDAARREAVKVLHVSYERSNAVDKRVEPDTL